MSTIVEKITAIEAEVIKLHKKTHWILGYANNLRGESASRKFVCRSIQNTFTMKTEYFKWNWNKNERTNDVFRF